MERKAIGIMGCGAIGTLLAEYADRELKARVSKIILHDTAPAKAEALAARLAGAAVCAGMEEVVETADLAIEAAASRAVPGLLRAVLEKRKDAMIMSIGGLLGCEKMLEEANEKGVSIILPSGAIAGIDGLKASKIAGISEVTLTTRKPPGSVKGAPYLSEKGINADAIEKEEVIFEGSAAEAMKGFPRNVNISALLSIAGIGAERTRVKIVVSPEYTRNTHEIEVKSEAGRLVIRAENLPLPENPKTSYLAALSGIASLRGYFETLRMGT